MIGRLKNKKKRVFVLFAILLSTLVFSLVYIIVNGQTYTFVSFYADPECNFTDIKVEIMDEDILSFETFGIKNKYGSDFDAITIKAKSMGDTAVTCHYTYEDGSEPFDEQFYFTVLPFNVIYDRTNDNFSGYEVLLPCFFINLVTWLIVLGMTFFERTRSGRYSYSMVALGGLMLYVLGMIISFIALPFLLNHSFNVESFFELVSLFVFEGLLYSAIVFPVLLLLSIALGISNLWLVKHEGFRLPNLLGIFLGLSIIAGFFAIAVMIINDYEGGELEVKIYTLISVAAIYIFCYFVNMLLSTILCSIFAVGYSIPYDVDYIIILGCAIRKDGTPTPILRGRIDRAIEFEQKQFEVTGKHAVFVPSGGQGSDEVISEAESMKQYLISQGIPEERILPEDKSVNTYQNMLFSKQLIEKQVESLDDVHIAFATTNYHVFRGYTLAKRVGMAAHGLSAKTKLYFFPNAFVREFIGLLYAERRRHLIYLLITVFSYTVLTFLFS